MKYKFPEAMGACADMIYKLREKRKAAQKIVDEIQAEESALRDHIIANLPKSKASGVAGKVARVSVNTHHVPQVEDWAAFYAYVAKNKAFDLMQRRLAESAVKERWENNKQVPGVKPFRVVTLSVVKA